MAQLLRPLPTERGGAWVSEDARRALRLHPEPCAHVDDWAVHEALTADPVGYLAHVVYRLEQIARGRLRLELPAKRILGDVYGDFRVMPCVTGDGLAAVKTVKVVGTNLVQDAVPDQITVGKALRLHPIENFVTAVYDACLLSSARTGACATIGLRALMPEARRIAIMGAGRVTFYTGLYLAASGPDVELLVCDRSRVRAQAVADALAEGGIDCTAVAAPPADVDAVVTATTSAKPILGPRDTKATCVVSVGADSEDQHELEPEWAAEADLYMDTVDALAVGDLRAWAADDILRETPVELLTLLRDRPSFGEERRVLVSTGSALFDNLTIEYLELS